MWPLISFDYDDKGLSEVIYRDSNNQGITPSDDVFIEDLDDAINGCPTDSIIKDQSPFQL